MTLAWRGTGEWVDAGYRAHCQERARTAAVMRATAEQLRQAAAILYSSAAATPRGQRATRLRALGDAVLVQADDITARADRLVRDGGWDESLRPSGRLRHGAGAAGGDDERPLP
ncbi:hypothetical protein AB0M79_34695 [Polymorphospora sp. NPDC051019]|uniref:hypothetical protein n=1 Tax=Polymorphospora sp. NPDC051019 TaxID=3155725 RepID=UPI003422C544